MNKITISSITSIIPAIMLGIGLGIVFVLPIVTVALPEDDYGNETVIEKTINGLMESALPFVLLLLGSVGLGVHSYLTRSFKYAKR